MTVPFFNYPHVFTSQKDQLVRAFVDVCGRGAFIMQKDLAEFERALADFVGARHCVGVANATDGLYMALRIAGIGAGDEVVFCSHTMVATAGAIHTSGATPVPVECGGDSLIDPDSVEAAITPRTRAIMPTQLNGRTCDMDRLEAIAAKHGLLIIEDAAQALGSKYRGRGAGTFGMAAALSFYPAKVLGCFGDGGAVFTNDDNVYEQLMLLRDHGRNAKGEIAAWGINSRLDNVQAALLHTQFHDYPRVMERRRQIARLYRQHLGDVPEVVLPPGPDNDPDHFHIYQNYECQFERRDDLKAHLAANGVGTMVQWGGQAVHTLRALGFTQSLPFTEALFGKLLLLPLNMSLGDGDVTYVAEQVRGFYNR